MNDEETQDERTAFRTERRRRLAIEEAVQSEVPNTRIDFEGARRRELDQHQSRERSALFHELVRREAEHR